MADIVPFASFRRDAAYARRGDAPASSQTRDGYDISTIRTSIILIAGIREDMVINKPAVSAYIESVADTVIGRATAPTT